MIYLHTGQPGAGKSLYTIWKVQERAQAEKRPVFYSGITDCKVPGWIELPDAMDWSSCPDGALIVIDEAQRIFRPRHVGSQVPAYVAALETHRHRGFDLYVVTQHPTLVEANVRRVVGTHRHIMRAFGSHAAIVHEWNEVRTDCDTKRDGSVSTTFRYPKQAFSLYKSAEVHTHKARVPMRVWLVFASPLFLGLIAFGLYKWISARTDPATAGASVARISGTGPAGTAGASAGSPAGSKGQGSQDWYASRLVRVAGLAHTAPVYDGVTQPTTAPYPAACIASQFKCRCYSQQATRLDMPDDLCRQLAERGFFKDWQEVVADHRPEVPRVASTAGYGGGGVPPM